MMFLAGAESRWPQQPVCLQLPLTEAAPTLTHRTAPSEGPGEHHVTDWCQSGEILSLPTGFLCSCVPRAQPTTY